MCMCTCPHTILPLCNVACVGHRNSYARTCCAVNAALWMSEISENGADCDAWRGYNETRAESTTKCIAPANMSERLL